MGKTAGRKKWLSALVALSLMAGGVVEARDHQVISYDGYDAFDIIYFDKADQGHWAQDIFNGFFRDEEYQTFYYDFPADMKSWINEACLRWAEILKPGLSNIKKPAQIIVGSANFRNAGAENYDSIRVGKNYFKDVFTAGADIPYIDFKDKEEYEKRGYDGFSIVAIGQGDGAPVGDDIYGFTGGTVSQNNHIVATDDLTAIMFHEMGHALGISATVNYDKEKKEYSFGKLTNDPLDYSYHLLDENGHSAKAGQIIVSPDAKDENGNLKYTSEQLADTDTYFQLSTEKDGNSSKGKAFFSGKNVSEVLDGKTFWGIDGIPVNGWESGVPELSHIELERSTMSHQWYRSYNTFMEAELAVMQDLGYHIDRRNFYGRSIYNDGLKGVKNTRGFFARNEAGDDYIPGKANTATMGVGLHVYGSRNEVTQTSDGKNDGSADLLACGAGGAGIRIDGVENTVTLAKDAAIEANGQNGTGILVAYGRDHMVNVEGNVSALGDGGVKSILVCKLIFLLDSYCHSLEKTF